MISAARQISWTETERAARMFASSGHWSRVYGILRNVWDSTRLRQSVYGPRMLDTNLFDGFDYLEENWPKQPDPVFAMQQFENQQKLVNDLLWQEDRLSMAHGLEVRVPFVDYHLRQQLAGWSLDELMPGGKVKGGMRKLLQPVLPAEILNRPKSGFQVSAGQFFQRYLGTLAKTYLSREMVVQHGFFNPEWIESSMRLPPVKAYRWHYFMLYLMLLTHIWVELFEQDTWQSHL
jgi:asparagine synthase (glutamine-hydrolysing)